MVKQICPERYVDVLPSQLNCTITFIGKDLVEVAEPSTEVNSEQVHKCSYKQINEYVYIRGSDLEDKIQERWILKYSNAKLLGEFSIKDSTTNSFVVAQVSLTRDNNLII